MSRASPFTDEPSLRCTHEGCTRRWVNDFGFGRLCTHHDDERRGHQAAERAQRPLPTMAPAAPHWQDEVERDDSPLPF